MGVQQCTPFFSTHNINADVFSKIQIIILLNTCICSFITLHLSKIT